MKLIFVVLLSILAAAAARGDKDAGALRHPLEERAPEVDVDVEERHDAVKPNSIPYQLSVKIFDQWENRPIHYCGASIINENTALTSAQCCTCTVNVFDNGLCVDSAVTDWEVVAGEHDLLKVDEYEQSVKVTHVFPHPDFDDQTLANDICIIKLESELQMNEKVQPVKLPNKNQEFTGNAVLTGWEEDYNYGGYGSDFFSELRSSQVPIVADTECNRVWVWDMFTPILPSMMCMGDEDPASDIVCQSDVGNPVVCDGGVQCGILIGGYTCQAPFPLIVTKTSYFIDFIYELA